MKIREARSGGGGIRAVGCVFLCAMMLLGMGCESSGGGEVYAKAFAAYEGGRYAESYAVADKLVGRSGGETRDRARFLAGMSAYQLDRPNDAVRHLIGLTRNKNDEVAGPAAATVGLAYAKQKRHTSAIVQFQNAVKRLVGEDQAQAYYHLALSEKAVGRTASASTHLSLAYSKAKSAKLKDVSRGKISTVGYTLQLGAFLSNAKAKTLVKNMSYGARRAGLGEPRVVTLREGGKTMYLVQVGRFSTNDSALRAKEKLGFKDAYIKRLGG